MTGPETSPIRSEDMQELLLGSPRNAQETHNGNALSDKPSPYKQLSKGRSLSMRVSEATELYERSEALRDQFTRHHAQSAETGKPRTLGRFLAERIADAGVRHWFAVPGDFNLSLLDQLLLEQRMQMVNTCNELNGGYAADGYARACGISCLVTTFSVGGLSAINAVAGAYAEDLPIICVVGAPPSTAWGAPRILHHSLGKPGDLDFELNCYKQVTCYQAQLRSLDSAYKEISAAIAAALTHRKPVYISVPSNLADATHPSFAKEPVPFTIPPPISSPANLELAVGAAVARLATAVKPVLVCGARMRSPRARAAMQALAEASGMPVAVMPNAKGLFPEDHPNFIGVFWENISTPYTGEVVVSSDVYLMAGPVFTDASTCGFTHMLDLGSLVEVGPDTTLVGRDGFYGNVLMEDVLEALLKKVPAKKGAGLQKYRQMYVPPGVPSPAPDSEPLLVKSVYKHIQALLTGHHALLVDAGDSWFHAHKLQLPRGCGYEIQLLYASIGWSLGACLGYGLGAPSKRPVCIIGDGAFQMTAQELSTILRYGTCPIIIIMNNGAYTIEIEIHDGPYNLVNNWDYTALAKALDNGKGRVHAVQVRTDSECEAALREASEIRDKAVVVECILDKEDCSVDVLQFGKVLQFAASKA